MPEKGGLMSESAEAEQADDEHAADARVATPSMVGQRVLEMDVIGWIIFVGVIVVMIPLLPLLALIAIVLRLLGYRGHRRLAWR